MAKKTKKAKKTVATKKRVSKKRVTKAKAAPRMTAEVHSAAFQRLVVQAHKFEKSPVCYKEFPDGSAQVCKLMPDGTYGDCQRYDLRPVPGPRCG